jgi:hypothetical protein
MHCKMILKDLWKGNKGIEKIMQKGEKEKVMS